MIVLMTEWKTTRDRNGNSRSLYVFTEICWHGPTSVTTTDGVTKTVFVVDATWLAGARAAIDEFRAHRQQDPTRAAALSIVDNGSIACTPTEYRTLKNWRPSA